MEYLTLYRQRGNVSYYIKHIDDTKEYYKEIRTIKFYGADIAHKSMSEKQFKKEIKELYN